MSPKEVIVNQATGRVSHLVLARTEQDETTGEWKIDADETLKKVLETMFSECGPVSDPWPVRKPLKRYRKL